MPGFDKKPNSLLKFFFKVPVWLHKIGFGGWERSIGAQWMLLTTTGRKTGKPRQVMVDVMRYDNNSDTYYIEAAYGIHADWYKNIQCNPIFVAQVGRRKFKAHADSVTNKDAGEMLVEFYRQKPVYTRSVMAMAGVKFKDENDLRTIGKDLMILIVKPEKIEN